MKKFVSAAAIALLVSLPALAQNALETVTKAATNAAAQSATDAIDQAAGKAEAAEGKASKAKDKGEKKAKKARDDHAPNWGKSGEHRQDGKHSKKKN